MYGAPIKKEYCVLIFKIFGPDFLQNIIRTSNMALFHNFQKKLNTYGNFDAAECYITFYLLMWGTDILSIMDDLSGQV